MAEKLVTCWHGSKGGTFEENVIEMYSKKNAGKSVFVEQFIWTIKSKNYRSMSSISKII